MVNYASAPREGVLRWEPGEMSAYASNKVGSAMLFARESAAPNASAFGNVRLSV